MTGRDRKNSLKALFSTDAPAEAAPAGPAMAPEVKSMTPPPGTAPLAGSAPAGQGGEPHRATSGAVKAMGLSLSSITREAEEARSLRAALEQGDRVVPLDPERVEASFVSDRLIAGDADDPDFESLLDSMRESGQQVPILVRPLEGTDGRYQVAYGHRRLKAARRLGIPVRAIVRALTDEELILAQGKENAERRNLSFIERAMFARALAEQGIARKVIGEALGGLKKDEMSRLARVTDVIPAGIIHRIGPAPKAGRDRWLALAEIFASGHGAEDVKALDEASRPGFAALDSDRRFQRIFNRLVNRPKSGRGEGALTSADGAPLGRIEHQGKTIRITLAAPLAPQALAAFDAEMAALIQRLRAQTDKK